MNSQVGMWIDSKKAVIVTLKEDGETIKTVESGVDRKIRLAGGSRSHTPYGAQNIASDSQRHEKHQKQLTIFFRTLIDLLRNAESIYLIGPGRAKNEFKREIDKKKSLKGKIISIETMDKMSDRQVAAAVKSFYERSTQAETTTES